MTGAMRIRGVGVAGPFGCGREAAARAIETIDAAGPNSLREIATPDGPVELACCTMDLSPIAEFFAPRKLRRVSRFAQMVMLGVSLALKDAGLKLPDDRSRVALIVATGFGALNCTFSFLDSLIDCGDACGSPLEFSNSVHSAAASSASIFLGLTGPMLTVSQFHLSAAAALTAARAQLAGGQVDMVLYGGADEISDVMLYYHACMQARGLYRQRGAVAPGEAVGFMVLTAAGAEDEAAGCDDGGGVKSLGRLTGGQAAEVARDRDIICGTENFSAPDSAYDASSAVSASQRCYAPLTGALPAGQAVDAALAVVDAARLARRPDAVSLQALGDGAMACIELSA